MKLWRLPVMDLDGGPPVLVHADSWFAARETARVWFGQLGTHEPTEDMLDLTLHEGRPPKVPFVIVTMVGPGELNVQRVE